MNLDFTGSTLFLVLLRFAVGLICIIKGGDLFVDAATWIAEASGIPKFIIGANIMDLTLIMPLCALILGKPLPVERQGMLLDIPACLVVCAGALIPALVQGRFKRWVGFFIGGLYIAYLVIMFTCFGA